MTPTLEFKEANAECWLQLPAAIIYHEHQESEAFWILNQE